MPVGTAASVKALTIDQLKQLSTQHTAQSTSPQVILNNTYHLMLRPGIDLIETLGGVHKLMNWDRAVLSDSGGFQVWSLASMRKVREECVELRSHLDGSLPVLSPEVPSHAPPLRADKPRYLMGVGTPQDLLDGVAAGIDMFDCVMPTRNARNGTLFTSVGKIAIKNARFAADQGPLDPRCACVTCRTVSRAYLRHLYVTGEIAALVYNTIHNVFFYLDLMRSVRQSIALDSFGAFRETFLSAPTNEGS